MAFAYKVTVCTPTYNRAYILGNLYHSLQRQSCTDFEWLIVDDGSTDDTQALVASWQAEGNPFPIRYVRQENGGKCRAMNQGLKLAQGLLFFTVDSDDYLTDDALKMVVKWEEELPKTEKFCGFAGNMGTSPTQSPNTSFPGEFLDGNAFDRYGAADGERASVFYTEIHRKYLYPEFPGEKFLIESVTWNRMAHDGYKMRFFNHIIWVYEYKADGLTNAGYQNFLNNPQGTGLFWREKAQFLREPLTKKLPMWYGYVCQNLGRCSDRQIASYIGIPLWLEKLFRGIHSLKPNEKIQAVKEFLKKR